jgi:hypothetical protein
MGIEKRKKKISERELESKIHLEKMTFGESDLEGGRRGEEGETLRGSSSDSSDSSSSSSSSSSSFPSFFPPPLPHPVLPITSSTFGSPPFSSTLPHSSTTKTLPLLSLLCFFSCLLLQTPPSPLPVFILSDIKREATVWRQQT